MSLQLRPYSVNYYTSGDGNKFLRGQVEMEVKLDGDGYKVSGDGWGWM